jgi:addiction module RelE/StbE family toxin
MRLIWTRRATWDLAQIRSYIARDNPPAAARIAARIRQAVARLTDHPNLGRPGREPGTRELVVTRTRYIVAYSVDDGSVTILAVVHGARRWPRL